MLNLGMDELHEAKENAKRQRILTTAFFPCRLCHSRLTLTQESPNIYEAFIEFCDDNEASKIEQLLIANVCQTVWGIKYERHEFLPERICDRCLEMLKDFYKQRRVMQRRELELFQNLNKIISVDSKNRPGLNGNPGFFELEIGEEDCVIVNVDPDKLCETSDDEFMGTDGEIEMDDYDWDEEDEEDAPNDEVEMPLGMDAAQMALMQAHQSADLNVNVIPHPKSAFLCQYCDLAFTLQSDCHHHELTVHDDTAPYICNYCQLRQCTRPALITHIKDLHDAERPYVCAHCSKGFVRRSDLKKHTIVHTGVRPFSCHVCSKSFSRNTNLTKHLRIHSSIKPFVCQQCPRSFQTPLELMKHTRSHSEAKPYQCDRCSASFSRKDKLSMHQHVHVKRDVGQLKLCTRNNLVTPSEQTLLTPCLDFDTATHQQTSSTATQAKIKQSAKHSRNYRCDVCDKDFQRERDLQRHRALHMDRLLTCKTCGHGFNRREQLQRHEIDVHGPIYSCPFCCISFQKQSQLEAHMNVHELQTSVAKSNQAVLAGGIQKKSKCEAQTIYTKGFIAPGSVQQTNMTTSVSEFSFYTNMIPTMNLGFYSETRPEERNGDI